MSSRLLTVALLNLALVVTPASKAIPTERSRTLEYQVKSAFLFNFAKFVDWPSDPNLSPDSNLTLGVVGKDPFGDTLEETVRGKTVHGKKLVIRRFRQVEELEPCHILFISSSVASRLPEILERLRGLPVLTVGETKRFTHVGGVINFFVERKMVRFEINAAAAERAGLRVSSRLLSLAKLVGDGDRGARN